MQTKNDLWVGDIKNYRSKIFSQSGEEGYLEFILNNVGWGLRKYIVDIGASDGTWLSNTKYLAETASAHRLMFDGNNKGNPEVFPAWITAENICSLLKEARCPKEFSLLSFDIDGNDAFVLDAILKNYAPRVIIAEINGTIPFGISKTIKYNPEHTWGEDDYYGFSISAGLKLAEKHGYRIVFQNDSLNAYFVRKDLLVNPEQTIDLNYRHIQYHPHNSTGVWVEY